MNNIAKRCLERRARLISEVDAVERHHPVGQAGEGVEVGLAVELRLLLLTSWAMALKDWASWPSSSAVD